MAYQLLGEIVARIGGVAYTEAIHERILGPLGMASSAFAPLPTELLEAAPWATGPAG